MKSLVFLFLFAGNALYAIDEKTYAENQRLTDGCVDLRDMSHSDKKTADEIQQSLAQFLNANRTAEDKSKDIGSFISGVGVEGKTAVVILRRSGKYQMDVAGLPLRGEERKILENYLKRWTGTQSLYKGYQYRVRFDDECDIPVSCLKAPEECRIHEALKKEKKKQADKPN